MHITALWLSLCVFGALTGGFILGLIIAGSSILEREELHDRELARVRDAWRSESERLRARLRAAGLVPGVRTAEPHAARFSAEPEPDSYGGTTDEPEPAGGAPG